MKIRRLLLSLAVLTASAAAAVALWVRAEVREHRAEMERRVDALVAEARARVYRPPILLEPPLPGNAWDDYEKAAAESEEAFGGGTRARRLLQDMLTGGERSCKDVEEDFVRLPATSSILNLLIRGARRTEASYPRDWERLESRAWRQDLTWLCNLAEVEATRLLRRGETAGALDLIWAEIRLGLDVGANGTHMDQALGCDIIHDAVKVLRRLVLESRLDAMELREAERRLREVERAFFAQGPAFRHEVLSMGQLFLRGEFFSEDSLSREDVRALKDMRLSWRELYSIDFVRARAFLRADQWSRRLEAAQAMSYDELRRVLDEVRTEAQASRTPLERIAGEWIAWGPMTRMELTRIRLLRTAIRYRLEGELLPLQDPYGSTLKVARGERWLRLWSLGPNGRDDGGQGGKGMDDIVLEFLR